VRRDRQRRRRCDHPGARGPARHVGRDPRRVGRLIPRRPALIVALAALLLAAPPTRLLAQSGSELEAARAVQADAARRYRESLVELRPLHEAAEQRAAAELERRRALLAQGLIARADVEAAERAWDEARRVAERTRTSIVEADALVSDAEAARELAALPPPRPGETQEAPGLVRFAGVGRWSLATLPALERFFAGRFGRALPISALGQTTAHDRLGFDHRNAIDVALHPDSAEGRTLMNYLRAHGIPFLAFRAARAGVATGAHIHVGEPSERLAAAGAGPGRGGAGGGDRSLNAR
jgi:hypothetical protein